MRVSLGKECYLSNNGLFRVGPLGSPRLLRVDQAAKILERSPRTVRYHAQRGSLKAVRKGRKILYFYDADVYEFKVRLELYYVNPFKPGSRQGRKAVP